MTTEQEVLAAYRAGWRDSYSRRPMTSLQWYEARFMKAWRARAADELTRITEEDGLCES